MHALDRHISVLVSIIFFSGTLLAASATESRITLQDLVSAERLGEAALSPDGREIALARDGQIVLMPADGGWPVPLTTTTGGKSGPSWSPDGRHVAYASRGHIWVVPASGGEPRQLTHAPPGPGDPRRAADGSPRWSPAGKWILFETGRNGNQDLMVVSEDGMTTSFLTMTEADEGSAAWSPDGKWVSYTERAPEYFSGKLEIVGFDEETGAARGEPVELHRAPTDRGGGWAIPEAAWAPDGQSLVVVLQHSGWDKLYSIPVGGGEPKPVTDGDTEDGSPVFSPDGESLAFVSNRQNLEERHVWILPLDGGTPHRLTHDSSVVERAPAWSPDGDRIFFSRSTPLEPENLMVADSAAAKAPRHVTRILPRNFEHAGFPMPEEVLYQGKDGLDIAAMLYKPREFEAGKRFPAVLWIHGGPEGQDVFNWDPWALFLTQEGYIVLQPNYRGSRGYGEAFRNLNVEDSGGGELDDVAAGARYLVEGGLADPARLGIGGGSHGGTMVAYAVTKVPQLFQAAVELFGVTDRATYIERTNRGSAIRWIMKMGGTPAEKPDVYRKANVLLDVARIETPLLVMHGEEDPQVPPYESTQFVKALSKHGKTHAYFTYPGEPHGFRKPEHRIDAWTKQLAFLAKYLQPEYGRAITSTEELVLKRGPHFR